jgi:hypothetical protein
MVMMIGARISKPWRKYLNNFLNGCSFILKMLDCKGRGCAPLKLILSYGNFLPAIEKNTIFNRKQTTDDRRQTKDDRQKTKDKRQERKDKRQKTRGKRQEARGKAA